MRKLFMAVLAGILATIVTAAFAGSPSTLRFATFNVSMYRGQQGALRLDLADPAMTQARLAARVLQTIRPDVVLLNEFDWDADGESLRLFRENFLAVGQDGATPIDYPYAYVAESNTGIPSGHDLDRDGAVAREPGTRAWGGDAFGFGQFPGQYAFVVLSRYPIIHEDVRSFRLLRWRDLPGTLVPEDWYPPAALADLRLSSKNHVDLPLRIGTHIVHLLASHPTPPTFDGPEDRNGRRNHDEIRFWSLYLGPDSATQWIVDDQGRRGGLGEAAFVIAGDLNADPFDGDARREAILGLLAHPRIQAGPAPESRGGVEQSARQGGRNAEHRGDPAHDTADFDDRTVGNLRLDYVLPSVDLAVSGSGVFWPEHSDPLFDLVGTHPFPVSDHRLVWVDVVLDTAREESTP